MKELLEKHADWSAATFQRKKVKLQGTKKKGCTATMHVKQVELYPQFRINIPQPCTKWEHKTASKEIISRLRLALQEEASGAFIVQFETALCIEEALNIFKAWNPTLSPKFWMVDYSQAEISALSVAFPKSRPVLCHFHRELAWHRWLSKKRK
ncbi:hypothetical protein MRX96_038447 [Rhipicephalus microplus]